MGCLPALLGKFADAERQGSHIESCKADEATRLDQLQEVRIGHGPHQERRQEFLAFARKALRLLLRVLLIRHILWPAGSDKKQSTATITLLRGFIKQQAVPEDFRWESRGSRR
jgi:hypothetical protein